MIADYTSSTVTTLAKTYTWGRDLSGRMQGAGGVGGLLAVIDYRSPSTGRSSYPTYDGNGNISEYLSAGGAIEAHYEYNSFGNIMVSNGAEVVNFEHKFSAKSQDSETGLYYYGYRYYDLVTGRWLSRDPMEEDGGVNLYGFVNNDGVNRWDYLGLKGDNCLEIPRRLKATGTPSLSGGGINLSSIGRGSAVLDSIDVEWEVAVSVDCCCISGKRSTTGVKVDKESLPSGNIFFIVPSTLVGGGPISIPRSISLAAGSTLGKLAGKVVSSQAFPASSSDLSSIAELVEESKPRKLDWEKLNSFDWKGGDPCKKLK